MVSDLCSVICRFLTDSRLLLVKLYIEKQPLKYVSNYNALTGEIFKNDFNILTK